MARRLSWTVAWAVVRGRFAVVTAWALAAAAAVAFLPSIFATDSGSLGNLLPASSKALVVEKRALREFGLPFVSPTLVVAHSDRPLSEERVRDATAFLGRVEKGESGLPLRVLPVPQVPEIVFSAGRRTTLLAYVYSEPSLSEERSKVAVYRFARGLGDAAGADQVAVTGPAPAGWAQEKIGNERLLWLELATVVIVIGVLAAYFRAVSIPLLGIATVAVAYLLAAHLLGWAGNHLGLTVPSEVDPVIVALLFGTLTDYVVFFVSGWRRRLAQGTDPLRAVAEVTAELLPVVLTAALMIGGSIVTLSLSGVHFLVAFVPGMTVSVCVGALVAVTFVPAVLAVVGPRLLWPGGIRPPAAESGGGARARVVGLAVAHPVVVLLASVAVLGLAGAGVLRTHLGDPILRGLPGWSGPRRGYESISSTFGPGVIGPTMIMVEGHGIVGERRRLAELQLLLEGQPDVAAVIGPAEDPLAKARGVVFAPDGDAARYAVVFDASPSGARAAGALSRLEGRLPSLLERVGLPGATAVSAGDTAVTRELAQSTRSALAHVVPIALLVPLLLLWALLRSKRAALYLVAVNVLTILATLGLTTYFFQSVLGYEEVAFFVPIAAAILLLALGSDYNVFFVSRIWQEAEHGDPRRAIVTAGSRAGRTVTVAGLTLVLSFAAVALVPILSFRELAFALAVGLLIDTLVARTLLVPALVRLFGGEREAASRAAEPQNTSLN